MFLGECFINKFYLFGCIQFIALKWLISYQVISSRFFGLKLTEIFDAFVMYMGLISALCYLLWLLKKHLHNLIWRLHFWMLFLRTGVYKLAFWFVAKRRHIWCVSWGLWMVKFRWVWLSLIFQGLEKLGLSWSAYDHLFCLVFNIDDILIIWDDSKNTRKFYSILFQTEACGSLLCLMIQNLGFVNFKSSTIEMVKKCELNILWVFFMGWATFVGPKWLRKPFWLLSSLHCQLKYLITHSLIFCKQIWGQIIFLPTSPLSFVPSLSFNSNSPWKTIVGGF